MLFGLILLLHRLESGALEKNVGTMKGKFCQFSVIEDDKFEAWNESLVNLVNIKRWTSPKWNWNKRVDESRFDGWTKENEPFRGLICRVNIIDMMKKCNM
jgi:hypothetical protein